MRKGRPSETALKVALTMVTLQQKPGWKERLPPRLADLSEQLILAANAFGYNRGLMRASKQRWMVRSYDLFDRVMPGIFEGLGERKIFMNNEVLAALEEGFGQVLVLGAGFDTLCLRLAPLHPDTTFFEIDHPDTARAKRKGVVGIGQPDNMTMIAADLGEARLSDVLSADPRWDAKSRSIVVMEGLLYYLPPEDVRDVFGQLHGETAAGSRVAFSHVIDARRQGWAQPLLQMIGEPWLSSASVEEIPGYVGEGWQLAKSTMPGEKDAFEAFSRVERV